MLREHLHDRFGLYRINGSLPIKIPRKIFRRENFSEMLGKLNLNKGVEIGTQAGINAEQFCKTNVNIDLTCVDPWWTIDIESRRHGETEQNMFYKECVERLNPYNARILKMTSMEALSNFKDGSLDFVVVDGNHDFNYAITDIIFWAKKVKAGGIIMVHDYDAYMTGVVRAVDSYTHCNGITEWYLIRESGKHPQTAFWVNK